MPKKLEEKTHENEEKLSSFISNLSNHMLELVTIGKPSNMHVEP